ncbi:MAG: hypoxanthine phosphoribosyltransferase, partial [Chloroflexi bacterium]|nr:hypoxanthine phosphoribosyltransferase [Chloroflexota bacterium]
MIAERVTSVLLEREQIAARVSEIGEEITQDYRGREPIFAPAMGGALVFFADLIRRVRLDLRCDLIWVSSYGELDTSSGRIDLLLPPREDWAGQDVVFVEDIVDTGRTAEFLFSVAKERRAKSARLCTLLDKPSRRVFDVKPD